MSTVYNGNGSLVSATVGAGTRAAISSSTNASPIVVTYGTAPGYNTGDTIEIEGHVTNTNANAIWQVTKQTATTYALNGSTGNGVGGATGYSIDYELLPAITIPANGELADMGPIGSALEGLANPAPFLYRAAGKYRLYNTYLITDDIVYWATWATSTISLATPATSVVSNMFGFANPKPIFNPADWIEVSFNTIYVATSSGSGSQAFAFYLTFGGVRIPGITAAIQAPPAPTYWLPYSVTVMFQVSSLGFGTPVTADFGISANTSPSPTSNVLLLFLQPWSLSVKHYRPN